MADQSRPKLLASIAKKGSDKENLAAKVMRNPDLIPELIQWIDADEASIKYGSAKILNLISQRKPELLYDRFDLLRKREMEKRPGK